MIEKFSLSEVTALRNELLQAGLDSWQTAELFQVFLTGRGYGASAESALDAARSVEGSGISLDVMKTELEKLALVM